MRTLNICEFREWIEFATIKGSENKYMYVWEIFLQSYPKKNIYELAKIKVANFAKLPISEIKEAQNIKDFTVMVTV